MNMIKELTSDKLRAVVNDGLLTELYELGNEETSLVIPDGTTGAAVFTLKSDDITAMECENCEMYHLRNSATDSSIEANTEYRMTEKGLEISVSTDSEDVSSFGINLEMTFLENDYGDIFEHMLPTSPYTSADGRFMFCIFTRLNGRYFVAAAVSEADGWQIKYSPESAGHYIRAFRFMASFDKYFGGSRSKRMSVILNSAESLADAYRLVGDIYGVPYIIPIVTGDFNGAAVVRVSDGVDKIIVSYENGESEAVTVAESIVTIMPRHNGKATLVPYKDGISGIDCVIWNENELSEYLGRVCRTVKKPYHGDYNLCEGGCGIWSLIRHMKRENSREFDAQVIEDLDITTGKALPYVARKTIAPEQEGFAPYHIYKSDRIQEQFFGVSILLDAYRLYGDELYLDYAVRSLDELIENWITPEGKIARHNTDYTTVTCPMIPIADMAVFFKDRNPTLYAKYAEVATRVADFVVKRGINFPTEGAETKRSAQFEDGSVSCSALTALYVAKYIECKPEYIEYGREILKFHEAWRINSPDAKMFGSSYRWWETVWEGDSDGPAICSGHAWTIWRSEALYLLGVLTHNSEAMIDSWNGFVTNLSKADKDGNMYAAYIPDYVCGGGLEGIRAGLLTVSEDRIPKQYKLSHAYPEHTDRSLSRYAVVRFEDTWLHTAAVIDADGHTVYIRCKNIDGELCCDEYIDTIYLDTEQDIVVDKNIKVINN